MRPIVFLHLPKTAGQSVRMFLNASFPKRLLFPGQLDSHLALYSVSDLRQYSIFAGHFSWAMLDCLGEQTLFFTILREPDQRILSFYRYLRRQAESLPKEQLALPQNSGIRFAFESKLEDWLEPADPGMRAFNLGHIDNYYTYYFATRVMNGRNLIRDTYQEADFFVTEHVMQAAVRNLRDRVRVLTMERLEETLFQLLSAEDGFVERKLNWVNRSPDEARAAMTTSDLVGTISGNRARAEELLHMRTQFDRKLYEVVT